MTEKFHGWQEIWGRHGFMRMFRSFMVSERISEKLLGLTDGERVLTNLQHVAECLHAAEYEKRLTPSTLLRWLREQAERAEGEGDRHVIRLEKDEKAVQIVTIHRSKGLEYSVVFCPFNWTAVVGKMQGRDVMFHDQANGNRLTWDLRDMPDPENVEAFKQEQLSEAIRLLYVAVTRARNRCYLFWAVTRDSSNADNSALAHAFACGRAGGPAGPDVAFQSLADEECAQMYQPTNDATDLRYRITKTEAASLAAQTFTRTLPQSPQVTSFSGLVARAHEIVPDRDSMPENLLDADWEKEAGASIFSFPKGVRAGNFFHSVLELVDFTRPETVPDLVIS